MNGTSRVWKTCAVSHTHAELLEAVASPDWGIRVVTALRGYFDGPGPLMEPVELVSAELELF